MQYGIMGWGVLIGIPALFLVAFAVPYRFIAQSNICAVRHFLGVPCPGCGLTRSISLLVHGKIGQSIDMHPLGIVIALWLVYFFLRNAFALISGRTPRELLTQKQRDLLVGAFLTGLILQWVVRLYLGCY